MTRAQLLQQLLQQTPPLLTALLILITGLNYGNEVLVTCLAARRAPCAGLGTVCSRLLLPVLLFAAVLPMCYAAANPEFVALRAAPLLAGTTRALFSVSVLMRNASIAKVFSSCSAGEHTRPLVSRKRCAA